MAILCKRVDVPIFALCMNHLNYGLRDDIHSSFAFLYIFLQLALNTIYITKFNNNDNNL